jgi:serine/threonine protein kinase
MTRILVSKTDREIPKSSQRLAQVSQEDVARFFGDCNSEEIEFALLVLKDAPDGAELRCHYKGYQLSYRDETSGDTIYLSHTYFKKDDVIYAKLDARAVGMSGSYAGVKIALNLRTRELVVRRKINSGSQESSGDQFDAQAGLIVRGKKSANPMKVRFREVQFGEFLLQFDLPPISENDPPRLRKLKPIEIYPYGGVDLNSYVENNRTHLSQDDLNALYLEILSAVRQLHAQGIMHLDLKPENILVLESNGKRMVRFCDFDMAQRVQPGENYSRWLQLKGTPIYLPPELLRVMRPEDFFRGQKLPPKWQEKLTPRFVVGEFPIATQLWEGQVYFCYSYAVDIFALGASLLRIQEHARIDFGAQSFFEVIFMLMTVYDPAARLDLAWAHLAALSLSYPDINEKQLTELLAREKLPVIALENFKAFGQCLVALERFRCDSPKSWGILKFLNPLIKGVLVENNGDCSPRVFLQFIKFIALLRSKSEDESRCLDCDSVRFIYDNRAEIFLRSEAATSDDLINHMLAVLSRYGHPALKKLCDDLDLSPSHAAENRHSLFYRPEPEDGPTKSTQTRWFDDPSDESSGNSSDNLPKVI